MKTRTSLKKCNRILFTIFAILIVIVVLFIGPQVGVADQGDFDRIMAASGLSLLDSDINNPNFIRFYDYIVTDYKITDINHVSDTIYGSSLGYLIVSINYICKLIGQTTFKTQYLAIFYSIIYILAFTIILNSLNIKDNIKFIVVSFLTLFIFFDGNYLVWFNSLYGEPMMLITLLLFIVSVLNYIHYKYRIKESKKLMSKIIYILLAAFLFLGSKLQVFTSLPFIVISIGKIIFDNKLYLTKINFNILCVLLFIIIIYPIKISMSSGNLTKDTEYNSVFYGILNGSKTPAQDLLDLNLNPSMAAEAGKHAYLDSDDYVQYIPRTPLTEEEFYNNISNSKLAKFYLTHPIRLLKGMEYTANKAFYTSTSLGKYYQSYSETPLREFHRFTVWSFLRENILPKNLYFIILCYLGILFFSLSKYLRNKSNLEIRAKILLLWTIMIVGTIQFPMPFVGNGKADTAKQLFLFNFIFDGLLVITFSYILFKISDLIKFKSKRNRYKIKLKY